MAYNPATDFLALSRQVSAGVRAERIPGLDYVVAALARVGLITLAVSQIAPTVSQATTAWFKPATPSTIAEGALFLWNPVTGEYEPATPDLWALLFVSPDNVVQDVIAAGPTTVQTNANVVRVQNVGGPVALVMPLSANMENPVLVSDWANHAGANNIVITVSGADVFPNGATTWTIAGDGGSAFFRPVPGGYAV